MKKMTMRMLPSVAVVLGSALLQGCGGGGSDDGGGAPIAGPEGIWEGRATTANGSYDLLLVVPGNGTYWGIYSQAGATRGVLQGRGSVSGSAFTSTDGRDYVFGGAAPFGFSLASTFTPKASIAGTATYAPPAGGAATFTAAYDKGYETPLALATLAGSYAGTIGTLQGVGPIVLNVGANGGFTGIAESGCLVSGSFAARGTAVVDMTASLDRATCGEAATFTGIAGLDGSAGRTLIFAAVTPDRGGAVFGTATRP